MKSRLNRIVLSASGIIMTASNALAAEFNNSNTGGFLTSNAAKLDSMLQPFGQFLAENVPLGFKLVVGCAILGYAALALFHKKKGNAAGASEHKNNAWDAATTGIFALILLSIFAGICKAFGV